MQERCEWFYRGSRACLRSWRQTCPGVFPGRRPAVKQEPRRVTAGIPVLQFRGGEGQTDTVARMLSRRELMVASTALGS
jgi:hypothetical protein